MIRENTLFEEGKQMFLSPVKEKLSVSYPELFSLLEKADGILYDKVVDESSLVSHEHPIYRCDTYDEAISLLTILATKRLEGYYIPGTNIPYIVVALRVFARMSEAGFSEGEQLAGFAWVLVRQKFATMEEIREICGDYVGNFVSEEHKTDYENYTISYYRHSLQSKFFQIEMAVLMTILRKLRKEHDRAFIKENPMPEPYAEKGVEWDVDADTEVDDYDDGYCEEWNRELDLDCDIDGETIWDRIKPNHPYDDDDLVYHKSGYARIYDIRYSYLADINIEKYREEYKAYCDRAQELFWKRFGVKYEDIEEELYLLFTNNIGEVYCGCNDILYDIDIINKNSIAWSHGYLHHMLF